MESLGEPRRPLEVVSQGKEYTVIASLPKNSTSLAVRAVDGGADAVLLNIDGDESASADHFGSYDLHDAYINDVISTVSVPCGIFIGGARLMTEEYWNRVMSSAFSFVEMYAHQMPTFVLDDPRVKKVTAISSGYILEQVKQLSGMDGVDAIEVATVPPQARGGPFSVLDCATLGVIAGLSTKPVVLRTQKRLTQADVAKVVGLGVKGLVVDPCVLSGTDEGYRSEISQYAPARSFLPAGSGAQRAGGGAEEPTSGPILPADAPSPGSVAGATPGEVGSAPYQAYKDGVGGPSPR